MRILTALLFPPRCIFCHCFLAVATQEMLCAQCAAGLTAYRWAQPFSLPYTDGCDAAFQYRGAVRDVIHRYKYRHAKHYAAWFSEQLQAVLAEHLQVWRPDCITYVPSGFLRYHVRGYNQSALIAHRLAKRFALPCKPLLRKRFWVGHQVGRTSEERQTAARQAFYPRRNLQMQGKRILLIDDVITTGATVSACSQALRQTGCERIFVLSIARAQAGGSRR